MCPFLKQLLLFKRTDSVDRPPWVVNYSYTGDREGQLLPRPERAGGCVLQQNEYPVVRGKGKWMKDARQLVNKNMFNKTIESPGSTYIVGSGSVSTLLELSKPRL